MLSILNTATHAQQHLAAIYEPSLETNIELASSEAPLFAQWHRLLAALAEASEQKWITLINPPFVPDEQSLAAYGISKRFFRVLTLSETNPNTQKHIVRSIYNEKSSLVAAWLDHPALVDDIKNLIADNTAEFNSKSSACKTLLFSPKANRNSAKRDEVQLEMFV